MNFIPYLGSSLGNLVLKRPSHIIIKKPAFLMSLIFCVLFTADASAEELFSNLTARAGTLHLKSTNVLYTGMAKAFFPDGNVRAEVVIREGLPEGVWQEFHNNGQLAMKVTYSAGKKEGMLERFHSNGKVWIRKTFKNGMLDGLSEYFNDDGKLFERQVYQEGALITEEKF